MLEKNTVRNWFPIGSLPIILPATTLQHQVSICIHIGPFH